MREMNVMDENMGNPASEGSYLYTLKTLRFIVPFYSFPQLAASQAHAKLYGEG